MLFLLALTDALLRRVLSEKVEGKVTTAHRHAEILELKKMISRNLSELRQSQHILMPGLIPIFDETRDDVATDGSFKLWLPSELSVGERDSWCLPDIPTLEFRFRYAQADDSLAELCRLRRLIQGLQDQNAKHPSLAQRSITRTQGLFEGFQAKIRRCASRYSYARDAMLALDPDQELSPRWMQRFQKLNQTDIRGPGRGPDDRSEGRFVPSWIWLVPNSSSSPSQGDPAVTASSTSNPDNGTTVTSHGNSTTNDAEVADSMRVHWAKCQARAERYEEEVALIVEEMGRTLRYFEWKKSWWLSLRSERAESNTPPPADVQRGLDAYACRQANVYEVLIASCANQWKKLLASQGLTPDWITGYPATTDSLPFHPSTRHSPEQNRLAANPTNDKSSDMDCESNQPIPSPPHGEDLDAPLTSDVENHDEDNEYTIDEAEVFDIDDWFVA